MTGSVKQPRKRRINSVASCAFLLVFLPASQVGAPASAAGLLESDQPHLTDLLHKVRDYCRRLERGAYDFVCLEEISEKIDHSRLSPDFLVERNHYVYDYQLVKKEGETRESRILLEKNRRKMHRENATLETKVFRHQLLLLRTVDLFGEFTSGLNNYRWVGEDTLFDREAFVLDAVPKPLYEERFLHGTRPVYLLGRIWIDKEDYSILKILWSPKVIRDIHHTEKLAKKLNSEPRITIISEYGVEKSGIRFPSRFYVEEAYISRTGRKYVRSVTETVYTNFKFFMVETEAVFDR